jgi:hypothetical protein
MRLFFLVCWGCNRESEPQRPHPRPEDSRSIEETGTSSGTSVTGDTGTLKPVGWPQWPLCSRTPMTQAVTLLADQAQDEAGRFIDVADVDGDGCAEVLVSAHRPYALWDLVPDTASYLLREPWAPGGLEDNAFAVFEGPPTGFDEWSTNNLLLPEVGQAAFVGGVYDSDLYAIHFYELPSTLPGSRPVIDDAVGRLHVPDSYPNFGVTGDLSDCTGADGTPRLCLGNINSDTEPPQNASGMVLVYDAPLVGDVHIVDDARSRIVGDDGERAQMMQSRADFDGDGRNDVLVGAFEALEGRGRIGVVTALPDGAHRLWDITEASISGLLQGGQLGLSMGSGDLDNDGYADVIASAPIGNELYVLRGPFAGDRSADTAEWTLRGTEAVQWTGYAAAITDLDADGQSDLAVGAPYSIYLPDAPPGSVPLWFAPVPGTYTTEQAHHTVALDRTRADAFGMSMAAGDIDGDGRGDLAIGAPRDAAAGTDAGSVTLVFGASL